MGWKKSTAADGTPRAREPYQDGAGQWCCPACGRASGFASKMAVLGHLRHCRPGSPKLEGILAQQEVSSPTSNVLHLPSPNEVTTVALLSQMQAQMQALQAQQQQIGKAVGNHIQHLSAQTAAPAQTAGTNVMPWVLGGLGVLVAAALSQQREAPQQPQRFAGFTPKRNWDDVDLMCRQLRERQEAGEEVDLPPSCDVDTARTAHFALKAESRQQRVRRGAALSASGLGDGLGLIAKAATAATAVKKLMRS